MADDPATSPEDGDYAHEDAGPIHEDGDDVGEDDDDVNGIDDDAGETDDIGEIGNERRAGDDRGGDGDPRSEGTVEPEAEELEGAEPSADDEPSDGPAAAGDADPGDEPEDASGEVPEDVRKYERFKKVDGAQYERVNGFLRDRTYITAREWAIARLCSDFRTETGVEMTKIGQNLPRLVPFMTDTYTPQAVNQARASFEEKVKKSGATFLYGAMCGFFTAEELDEVMYEVTEIAKFLLEVEGVDLSVDDELEAEERISSVMREVREASAELRREELE